MGGRDLARLSDEALADCFGRMDCERATSEALRKTVREEILHRRAGRLVGRNFVVSVTSATSRRWHTDALERELGIRAELFMYAFETTYVRSRSISLSGPTEFESLFGSGRNKMVNAARR